jgi:ubiquinone/menaquinone biosynthesis C-methylase UbiE
MQLLDRLFNWLQFNILYLGNPPWDTNQSPPELLAYIRTHQPGAVLDLGCGTGKNCLTLAQAGWETIGVDFAPKPVLTARNRFSKAGFQGNFLLADVSQLSGMDAKFDLVLDIGCFHALPCESREGYRAVINRVLKPGGDFLLYAHFSTGIGKDCKRLTPGDIVQFQKFLCLQHREDGEDRGNRKSLWLWFKRPVQ